MPENLDPLLYYRVSELPNADTITGTEVLEVIQNGENRKVLVSELVQAGGDGSSAYQVAVDAGFVGTEVQWLASLKGTDGVDGTNGVDGVDGADGAAGATGADGYSDEGLSIVRSGKDVNGVFTTIVYKRDDGTIQKRMVFTNGASPLYTTRTDTYYALDGVTVTSTKIYALTYDEDSDLVSEEIVIPPPPETQPGDLSNAILFDTFLGAAGVLDTAADIGNWGDLSDVNEAPWLLDGNGSVIPGGSLSAFRGGYLKSSPVEKTGTGFAISCQYDITEAPPVQPDAVTGFQLRLHQADGSVTFLARIDMQIFDDGQNNAVFNITYVLNGVTQFNHSVPIHVPMQEALTVGEHVFRIEISPNSYRVFIDGDEAGSVTTQAYMPAQAQMEVQHYVSGGLAPWKLDWALMQHLLT